jgi:microcystin-dependent protein
MAGVIGRNRIKDRAVIDEFEYQSAQNDKRFLKEHNVDGTHKTRERFLDFVPVGFGGLWFTNNAPTGWVICDGRQLSRLTYRALFLLWGTTYGAGDNSTTFNAPDLRQRFPLGKAATGTGSTLGATGGDIDHVHDGGSHTHNWSQSVATGANGGFSTNTGANGGHAHTMTIPDDFNFISLELAGSNPVGATWPSVTHRHGVDAVGDHTHSVSVGDHTHSVSVGGTTSEAGGDTGPANPPYLVVNYIVFTGVEE